MDQDDEIEDMEAWIDAPELRRSKTSGDESGDFIPTHHDAAPQAELYNNNYMDVERKKPPVLFVLIVVLLILSVFWKKIIFAVTHEPPVQVEQPVTPDNR